MMGSYFASAVDASGELVEFTAEQVLAQFRNIIRQGVDTYTFKQYRGMGSLGAMTEGAAYTNNSSLAKGKPCT